MTGVIVSCAGAQGQRGKKENCNENAGHLNGLAMTKGANAIMFESLDMQIFN